MPTPHQKTRPAGLVVLQPPLNVETQLLNIISFFYNNYVTLVLTNSAIFKTESTLQPVQCKQVGWYKMTSDMILFIIAISIDKLSNQFLG